MKKCPFCAEEIQEAAIKCRYCGSDLNTARSCPFCSKSIPADATICPHCRDDVSAGARKSAAAATTTVVVEHQKKSGIGGALTFVILCLAFLAWCGSQVEQLRSSRTPNPAKSSDSTTPTRETPSLKAAASFTGTQITVTNQDDDYWSDVKLEINGGFFSGGYIYRIDLLGKGEKASVGALQFAKSDGTRFNPYQVKPQQLTITAKVGGESRLTVLEWK